MKFHFSVVICLEIWNERASFFWQRKDKLACLLLINTVFFSLFFGYWAQTNLMKSIWIMNKDEIVGSDYVKNKRIQMSQ